MWRRKRFSTDKMFNCKVNVPAYSPWRREKPELAYLCLDAVGPERVDPVYPATQIPSKPPFIFRFLSCRDQIPRTGREKTNCRTGNICWLQMQDSGMHLPGEYPELIHQCIASWKTPATVGFSSVGMSTEKGAALLESALQVYPGVRQAKWYRSFRSIVAASGLQLFGPGLTRQGITSHLSRLNLMSATTDWKPTRVHRAGSSKLGKRKHLGNRQIRYLPERSASEITFGKMRSSHENGIYDACIQSSQTENRSFWSAKRRRVTSKGAMGTPDDEEYGDLLEMWGRVYRVQCQRSIQQPPDMFPRQA